MVTKTIDSKRGCGKKAISLMGGKYGTWWETGCETTLCSLSFAVPLCAWSPLVVLCSGRRVNASSTGKAGARSAALICTILSSRQPRRTSSSLAGHSACRVPNIVACVMVGEIWSEASCNGMKAMMQARL